MGGDGISAPSLAVNFALDSDISSDGKCGLLEEEFSGSGYIDELLSEAGERQNAKVYSEVMRTYEDLQFRIESLDETRKKILSYKPGLWANNSGNVDFSQSHNLDCTTFLVIGPRGSGKSSLINTVSRVLDLDPSVSGKAQVSCNSSEDGTFFLYEHRFPKGSGSFCLYDTRSLSDDLLENEKMLQSWMRQGVRHGELVQRKSDDVHLKARMKQKARRGWPYSKSRVVNFVIFVVNGLSVLESMMSPGGTKKQYSVKISADFHNAMLSFQDDKPIVVVTHGDLLPLAARARIRIFLGSLLGIPPASQIFDVPDSDDPATTMAVLDMLTYSLEHADRYLHYQTPHALARLRIMLSSAHHAILCCVFVFTMMAIMCKISPLPTESDMDVDWHRIRHLWSD